MREAALTAHMFALDPVVVLGEEDRFKALVRLASVLIVNTEEEKAQKRAEGK